MKLAVAPKQDLAFGFCCQDILVRFPSVTTAPEVSHSRANLSILSLIADCSPLSFDFIVIVWRASSAFTCVARVTASHPLNFYDFFPSFPAVPSAILYFLSPFPELKVVLKPDRSAFRAATSCSKISSGAN